MLYGFGGAVLIGFLLTASKNWVNVRGIHGAALMGLVGLWISERGLIFYSFGDGYLIKHLVLSLFPMASGAYIAWTLIRHCKVDTFKDNYFFLDTGSPHYVSMVNNLNQLDVYQEGKKIRYNQRFAETGTNVNFIEKNDDYVFVRTYERGVENETLSCGTGVTAAALVANMLGISSSKNN